MPRGLVYRAAQFWRSIGARPHARDLAHARSCLSDAQWQLFIAMSPRDQWHGIETLRLIRAAGWDDDDVARAALLHDAGKGYILLHERVLYVLLQPFPRLLRWLAVPDDRGWRGALGRSLRHPERTARLALKAGVSERTAALIRLHHSPDSHDPAGLALLDADERA